MAYKPSLQDIDEIETKSNYRPSINDIDELEKTSSQVASSRQRGKNIFAFDKNTSPYIIPKEQGKQFAGGELQGLENVGIGYANLLPGVNIPKRTWAGESEYSKAGQQIPEIASMFAPAGALKIAGKTAEIVPFIRNAIQNASNIAEARPVLNAIAKLARGTGESALYGAASADKEDQARGAGIGAGIGASTNILSQLARTRSPIINALARAGLGAGLGAGVGEASGMNPAYTAAMGATGAATLPGMLKASALSGGQPGLETLQYLKPEEVEPRLAAANRLGTPITPSEASGNPFIGKLEGRYGRTPESAAEKTRINFDKIQKQKDAVTDLMNTIHDNTPESKKKIADLYNQANRWNLKQDVVDQFKQDPVIEDAFKKVQSDPAYKRKLKDYPENSFAYLNQVKRAIDDMEGAAIKSGEKSRAAEFADARSQLLDAMDNSVPVYKQARQEAQRSIIRSKLNKSMRNKEITGKNFFDTFLKNDNKFDELHNELKNIPEAQSKLRDMKLAWKNLSNIEKPSNVAYQTEKSTNENRSSVSKIIDMWSELNGEKRNLEALKFIHSPEWDKGFNKINQIKDKQKRNDALADLIGRAVSIGAVNRMQGSNQNGDII